MRNNAFTLLIRALRREQLRGGAAYLVLASGKTRRFAMLPDTRAL